MEIVHLEEEFPIDVFTKSLQALILELNRTSNYPKNYAAASILAAASSAIGKTVQVKVMNTWFEQAVIYLVLSGRAGINKQHSILPGRVSLGGPARVCSAFGRLTVATHAAGPVIRERGP